MVIDNVIVWNKPQHKMYLNDADVEAVKWHEIARSVSNSDKISITAILKVTDGKYRSLSFRTMIVFLLINVAG